MASKAVYDAVKARLAANPIPGWPIYEPNDSRGDAPSDPFIAYEFPVATSEQITFGSPGSNTFREIGALRFVVAAARGIDAQGNSGLDAALTVVETLRALFRNHRDGSLLFWEMSPPVQDDRNADGNFYRLTIAGSYWLDTWA